MLTILMMSAKMALSQNKCFCKGNINKYIGYDALTSVSDVTSKILSRDFNYIVDVVT